MKNIKSKYIVKLKENFYDEIYEGYYIVMELCDSDLRKLLNEYKPKSVNLISKFTLSVYLIKIFSGFKSL